MIEITAMPGREIALGRRGENLAYAVVFNIADWQREYGAGKVHLLHQRCGDNSPYPCAVETADGRVLWKITSTDVALVGRGSAELQYYVGATRVKSAVYPTRTLNGLDNEGPTPGEPEDSWVEQVLEAATSAEKSKNAAEYAADRAGQNAELAKQNVEDTLQAALDSGAFKGDKGDKGDQGNPGLVAPVSGFFTLAVDEAGDLWAYVEEGAELEFEYDSETGALYIVQEV